MKRILAVVAGLLGLAWLRNREPQAWPPAVDPADELREKLAQARVADDRDQFESGEQPVDQVPDETVDERRRAVHDRARAAIDELNEPRQ